MDLRPCFVAALLITLTSCSIFGSDESALRLETNQNSYDLTTAEVIMVTVKNKSSSVIHFSTCMPTELEELDGRRVVASLGFPVCECPCRAELGPGEEWSHTVWVEWIKQKIDRLKMRDGNEFRLRLAFYEDKNMKVLLAEDVLYSNEFELTK